MILVFGAERRNNECKCGLQKSSRSPSVWRGGVLEFQHMNWGGEHKHSYITGDVTNE